MAEQDLPEPSAPTQDRGQNGREPIPWLWLGLGAAASQYSAALPALSSSATGCPRRRRSPRDQCSLSIIVLTAPPSATPGADQPAAPPTPIPTFTPIPTPDTAVAPAEINAPAFYAEVANTDDLGVTVRGGPSTRNVVVTVADEGLALPSTRRSDRSGRFSWWNVRLDNGLEGWAVQNFPYPRAAP